MNVDWGPTVCPGLTLHPHHKLTCTLNLIFLATHEVAVLHPHFTDEETEAHMVDRISQLVTINIWGQITLCCGGCPVYLEDVWQNL